MHRRARGAGGRCERGCEADRADHERLIAHRIDLDSERIFAESRKQQLKLCEADDGR